MPRKRPIIHPGDDVHLVFRCINKEFVFRNRKDHEIFLSGILRQAKRYQNAHYAWCGMSNHHHLFNQAPLYWHTDTPFALEQFKKGMPIPISAMVRDTQSFFAKKIVFFHGRNGDLIQDRTKIIKVYGDHHALTLLIYIFLNPIRAGIANNPDEYEFSNFDLYASGRDRFNKLFLPHPAYLRLGPTTQTRCEKFKELVIEAQKSWAKERWPGASGNYPPGRGKGRQVLEDFLNLSNNWIPASIMPSSPLLIKDQIF